MDKFTWICPKCGNEETVVLRPIETENGLMEFRYEDKFLRSETIKKNDIMLLCPVCRHREIIKENMYAEACVKSRRAKAAGGVTVETIAFGVAWGIIIASVALTFFYLIIFGLFS
jgi:hypothetical protein